MNIYILNATLTGKIATELLCQNLDIKGIISLDSSVGYEKTNEYYDYTDFCRGNNVSYIPLKSYNISNPEDKERIYNLEIDLIIVTSWQRLIPEWLIDKCTVGVIGSHGSPEGITYGRGRSPQNWALLLGRDSFELSIFWIEKGIDNGAIIDTRKFYYQDTDDIMISYIKINMLIADMVIANWHNNRIQQHIGKEQVEDGFYLPKRIKEDGKIDWNRSSQEIYNLIRALSEPYPGAFTIYQEAEFNILEAKPINIDINYETKKAGEIISIISNKILVKCGKGLLLIYKSTNHDKLFTGMIFETADYKKQMKEIIERHNMSMNLPISNMILDEIKK